MSYIIKCNQIKKNEASVEVIAQPEVHENALFRPYKQLERDGE